MRVGLVILGIILGFVHTVAQNGCYSIVRGNSLNIPYCSDSIVVETQMPIGKRDQSSTVTECARLYRKNENGELVQLKTSTDCGVGASEIVIKVLEPFNSHLTSEFEVAVYRLFISCGFWEAANTNETMFFIQKQNISRAIAVSRLVIGGQLIGESTKTFPNMDSIFQPISRGVRLYTVPTVDELTFSHWTCSLPDIPFAPNEYAQAINYRCWPNKDTVIFTAWYNGVISDVEEQNDGRNLVVQYNQATSQLSVQNFLFDSFQIFDVQGQQIIHGKNATNSSQSFLDLDLRSGVHVFVGRKGLDLPVVRSFVHHK